MQRGSQYKRGHGGLTVRCVHLDFIAMNLAARRFDLVSEEDYLASEELSDARHEYLNGVLFLKGDVHGMAGGTRQHATAAINIASALHAALRGKSCRPYVENMKLRVQIGEDLRFYFPDVMIVCQPSASEVWEDAPTVIFEVLSDGTERIDLGEKRDAYFTIPSLKAYVVIDSRRVAVQIFRRTGAEWKTESMPDATGVIDLPEIGCRLPLDAVYDGVL